MRLVVMNVNVVTREFLECVQRPVHIARGQKSLEHVLSYVPITHGSLQVRRGNINNLPRTDIQSYSPCNGRRCWCKEEHGAFPGAKLSQTAIAHSTRNVLIGSTLAARREGIHAATYATASNSPAATA